MVYRTTKVRLSTFRTLRFGEPYYTRSNNNGPFIKVGRRHRLATNASPYTNFAPTAVTDIRVAVMQVPKNILTAARAQ